MSPISTISPPGVLPPEVPRWWRRDGTLGLLLIGAVFLAYIRVWHAGFIWDDDAHVTANPNIIGPNGLREIWTTPSANYFPLVLTTFWALHAIWGLAPLPYHLTTLALHAVCAMLLWLVLRRLGVRGAWFGAVLWALHPVQVESVAWISELKNTQSCLFFLLATWFFLRWIGNKTSRARRRDYGLVVICAALAILSKPSTVMLPVALLLCWWWQSRRWDWRQVAWMMPLLFLSAVASGWTIWEQKYHSFALGPEWNQSLAQRAILAGNAVWFYLGKLVWPDPLIFIYPRWNLHVSPLAFAPLLAAALALAVLWRSRRPSARAGFFALAYFLALLFPVLGFFNVYFFRFSFVADHFQYLASMGPLALCGAAIAAVFERAPRIARWLAGGLIATFALLAWRETRTYLDAATLWQTTHEKNPACWMATTILGNFAADHGRYDEALVLHQSALHIDPNAFEVHYNLGLALKKLGRFDDAIVHYRRALELKPNFPEAEHNLGVALAATGHLSEAIGHYEQSLRLNSSQGETHLSLALALTLNTRGADAIGHYETALRLRPDYVAAHYALARTLQESGSPAAAIPHYQEVLRREPEYLETHYYLALAFAATGEHMAAVTQYESALRQQPERAEIHLNLANAFLPLGRISDAISHYKEALRIAPSLAEAHYNLALALHLSGRTREAKQHADEAHRLKPGLPAVPGVD